MVSGADPDAALAALDPSELDAVVAIGLDAAELAARELELPTVICQVFSYEPLLALRADLYAIAPLPPLALELERWRALAPEVGTVGLVLGRDHPALLAEARAAAAATGLGLEPIFAASDREALYRFKRLAAQIDGLWLLPDNEILSPPILREMLDYALDHGIHGIVFNPTLLDWGALLSVGSRVGDVAATTARVVDTLAQNGPVPARVTALTEIDARVNAAVAVALGLEPGFSADQPVSQARAR